MKKPVTYAQNREDIVIDWFFKDRNDGFYIDVGAGNPDIDSVTKLFYLKGWRGINVEPISHIHRYISRRRTKDINLNIGLSDKTGKLTFREYGTNGFSTFSSKMKDDYASHPDATTDNYLDYEVDVITLKEVFESYTKGITVQFLKVDVEGYEYEVLKGNDWTKYRPELLCVEANHIMNDWRPLLLKNSYIKAHHDGLNDYYVAAESSIPKSFDYVEGIIYREPIVHYKIQEEIREYIKTIQHKDNHVKELEFALTETQKSLERIRSLRAHVIVAGKRKLKSFGKKK